MDRHTSRSADQVASTERADLVRVSADDTLGLIACSIENAAQAVGISRTRIFDAVRKKELTVRKAGRATLIEIEELKRWVRSLPVKGRE